MRPCFQSVEMVSKKNEGFQCQEHIIYNHSKTAFQEKKEKFFVCLLSHAEKPSNGTEFSLPY
jgi:hypothetical protein